MPAATVIRKISVKCVDSDEQLLSSRAGVPLRLTRSPSSFSVFADLEPPLVPFVPYRCQWNKEIGAYEDLEPLDLAEWNLVDAANVSRCICCARRSVERAT